MTGSDLRKILSKQIKFYRTKKGMSQAQLAEKAEISITYVSSIEQSLKWPYPDTLVRIAAALEVEVSDLFLTGYNKNDDCILIKEVLSEFVQGQKDILDTICTKYLK